MSSPTPREDLLVWMDLEMTGLDPERERILEIAVVVTDADLEVVATGPDLILHQPEALLAGMDSWNTEHHGSSGLTEESRRSRVEEAEAEERVLSFLRPLVVAQSSPLCGNSIHQDRRFLRRYLPRLEAWFHYRNLDVSTVKELARRWYPDLLAQAPEKESGHRALADTLDSIAELRWYREHVFRPLGPSSVQGLQAD